MMIFIGQLIINKMDQDYMLLLKIYKIKIKFFKFKNNRQINLLLKLSVEKFQKYRMEELIKEHILYKVKIKNKNIKFGN